MSIKVEPTTITTDGEDELQALWEEKLKLEVQRSMLKQRIRELQAALDHRERIKKLPAYLYTRYVDTDRLTKFFVSRTTIVVEYDGRMIKYPYGYFDEKDFVGDPEGIKLLIQNTHGKKEEENAEWWNKILAAIKDDTIIQKEHAALACVLYHRCI